MNNISLDLYKGSRWFIKFFDVYIKQFEKNKEYLFNELGINYSSYRRCRDSEQNIGKEIVLILAKKYGLTVPDVDEIDECEELVNKIYYYVFYKLDDLINESLLKIEEKINSKSLLFPIYELLKLLIASNFNKSPNSIYLEYNGLFNEVKKYYNFFTEELKEIFEILDLFFGENDKLNTSYNNPMAFQVLASKSYAKGKFVEGIYFATKSQELLIKELNFKRYIIVNNTLICCYLSLGNYNEAYSLASKQLYNAISLKLESNEITLTKKYLYVSLLGLKEYSKLVNELEKETEFNPTFLTCLFVSLSIIDIDKYNEYISTKDKKILKKLSECEIMSSLIPIIRDI